MSYYAVHKGREIGVFTDWKSCKKQTEGFKTPVFKKFDNEADANEFVKNGYGSKSILQYFTTKDIQKFIPEISVYTDGACVHNGKSNALAGIGVYFGENDSRNVSSKIIGKQTNNTAELKAILKACEILEQEIKDGKKIMIYTDSVYSIRCCTTYGDKLATVGWTKKKPIPNIELVQKAYYFFKNNTNVNLTHVKAHTQDQDDHSIGNDHADRLANEAIGISGQARTSTARQSSWNYKKIYLKVPYKEKENAKSLGAKWDPKEKKWYIKSNISNKEAIFAKYEKIETVSI